MIKAAIFLLAAIIFLGCATTQGPEVSGQVTYEYKKSL
jgi:hypothetical protein